MEKQKQSEKKDDKKSKDDDDSDDSGSSDEDSKDSKGNPIVKSEKEIKGKDEKKKEGEKVEDNSTDSDSSSDSDEETSEDDNHGNREGKLEDIEDFGKLLGLTVLRNEKSGKCCYCKCLRKNVCLRKTGNKLERTAKYYPLFRCIHVAILAALPWFF